MNTKKNTIKSVLCCITGGAMLAMAGLGVMKVQKNNFETYAVGTNSILVDISNSNFNESTQSTYPYKPSSFTAYNGDVKDNSSSSSSTQANIKAGVINLDNENYSSKFSLAKRSSLDDYVLMLDSSTEDDGKTTFHSVNYGFRTSSNIKMEADSRYMLTVDIFSATNTNTANLYLYDNSGEVFSKINNINSYNTWTTYTFFVATNNTQALELTLGMYLEGEGTILFDNLSCYKLSKNEYEFNKKFTTHYKEENKIDNIITQFLINENGKLEKVQDNSFTSTFTQYNYEPTKNSSSTVVNHSDGYYEKALLLENVDATYAQYETREDLLTFKQNSLYKVSLNVKTSNLNGKAYLSLLRTDIDKSDVKDSHNATIEITSNTATTTENVLNDFKTYSFYIKSHPSKEVTYKLDLGLGKDANSLTSGKMYISGIEVSKINNETFSASDSNSKQIDLVKDYAYSDSKIRMANGQFNDFKIADYNNPMPATPTSWDIVTGSNIQKYGVVNTSTFDSDLSNLNLSNLMNPSVGKNENVLMMYNEAADTLIYKSASKSLDAKTYHKFELNVQTQNTPVKISLITKKNNTEVELSSITVNTKSSWENVSLYLYTAYQKLDVSIKLTMETESYGYAYIDDVRFDYPSTQYTTVEEEFNDKTNSTYTVVTNLENILNSSSSENFASNNLFTSTKVKGVEKVGVVTLNSAHLDEVIYDNSKLETFNSLNAEKVLGIRATEDVYYTATSNVGFDIESGDKYYKVSISVYTQNIDSNDSNVDLSKLGATIKLSSFEEKFTNIVSNNGWTTYTLYIKAESNTTAYLELSIGNADVKAKGDVFFGNITFEDNITAEEFDSVKETSTVKVLKTQTKTEENEETTEDKQESKISKTTWIYLIPSLLTALAIVIAVVGICVRKIKWKKPTKKSKTSYDRNKTVSVQYYSRKATTMREAKLRELQSDLDKLNAQRKTYEDEYKQDLSKLREMKIKRANPNEIAKLEKDLKKNQKLSANIGVSVNKISSEIEIVKTDAYLNSLIKKLQREPVQNTESEEK